MDSISDLIKPFSWIIGVWESTSGKGDYPNIADFTYNETLEFKTCGKQPLLAYSARSSNPMNGNPMHLESGFLRSRGGGGDTGSLSFMVAHNFGLTTIEEGELAGHVITLKSKNVARMTDAKDPEVKGISRTFALQDDGSLVQELSMATTKTPEITHHLTTVYNRKT